MLHQILLLLDAHGTAVQGIAAIVQALAAVIAVVITTWLVFLTRSYTSTIQRALLLGQQQFELYREQFEREWRPSLHLRVVREEGIELEVTNLSRMAVVVTRLHIRLLAHPNETFSYPIPRPFPLGSAGVNNLGIVVRLEKAMRRCYALQFQRPSDPKATAPVIEVPLSVCLDFTALGHKHQTEWFEFVAEAVLGNLTALKSKEMSEA
jgi:hypothetical protein